MSITDRKAYIMVSVKVSRIVSQIFIYVPFFFFFLFPFHHQLHSDQDKGDGSLKYILSGDGAGDLFIINENTGDIQATKRLDREEKPVYILRAQAINRRTGRPVEPESEFIIKIHDINDNEPMFTKDVYNASIPEMSDVGRC